MDFKCSSLTILCKHFWSHVPSPLVAGGYSNAKVKKKTTLLLTELVKRTPRAAVLLDFANICGLMYLLHLLQVAIVTRKSKKQAAFD